MSASGLLETMAALALAAAIAATLTAGLITNARIVAATMALRDDIVLFRQAEHLIDNAIGSAGDGPRRPPPLAQASAEHLVIDGDTDGDGTVDARSSERTTLYLRSRGQGLSLMHRLGRQSMTLVEDVGQGAAFSLYDRSGRLADRLSEITLVALSLPARKQAGAGSMLWALPARPEGSP